MKACPKCGNNDLMKYGKESKTGKQVYMCKICNTTTVNPNTYQSNKKIGVTNWREVAEHCDTRQKLHEKASYSQDRCFIDIGKTDKKYIILQPIADTHIGSIGTRYADFIEWTDEIIKLDSVYMCSLGDMVDKFSTFKNMLAVHQMILSPEEQDEFIESWVEEVSHKFLFSTWGNHEAMQERASGQNTTKRIFNRKLVYFNGIGICDLRINNIDYKIVATHSTPGNSVFNPSHGMKRIAREMIPNADVYMSGHNHKANIEQSVERDIWQIFLKMGTLKTNDGHAKRYFNYYSDATMPCIVFNTQEKESLPFKTLNQARQFIGEI
jgi:hypothetical protein